MMQIECPFCGLRDYTEFTYGGDATDIRPRDPDTVSNTEWIDYVYIRNNPRGAHNELWYHGAGCRRWTTVCRNTLTHEVSGISAVNRFSGKLP